MKKLYLISIFSLFLGCGGGSNSSSPINQHDNNQSTLVQGSTNDTDNNRSQTLDNPSNNDEQPREENNQPITEEPIVDNDNQVEDEQIEQSDREEPIKIVKRGKAQLGVLSKAMVKLYELTGEEKKLLATELTTHGETIENIGNFNLHLEKLIDDKLYLYQVSGGEDYDVDDDGVIDDSPTQNKGIFHLLALGSHLKAIQQVNITVISEIIYQKLSSSLSLQPRDILDKMELLAKEIIQQDINSDSFIGIEDIFKYNPITDKIKLQPLYQNNLSHIIDDILNNKNSDFDAPIFKEPNLYIKINENLIFIKKIEIIDASKITTLLKGVDAREFNYNPINQELSFKTPIDFETPQDNNHDNIFELTIEATDSYFNESNKSFSIEIMDINETIPQIPILKESHLSLNENNLTHTLIGTVTIVSQGTDTIKNFTLMGNDAEKFEINKKGELFSTEVFDFEIKNSYSLQVEASNSVGTSNPVSLTITINDIPDIKPIVKPLSIEVFENRPIGTIIGQVDIQNYGDSNITEILLTGYKSDYFSINPKREIKVLRYLDYETTHNYNFRYSAMNQAGESEKENLTIIVKNIYENSGSDYPPTESGIQNALDQGDYSFVLNQLLNNRDAYSGLDDDTVNMNIAGAYVGSSGYTIYDITGAMSDGNNSSFNDFVNNITQDNDSVSTINKLEEADTYYSNIVQGVDCNNTAILTQIQKDSCYNLGLVRLTSLTNSVKLLFGGDSSTVEKWAEGVDINSSDDLNGNGVLDDSEASACAIVYANNPNDNCQNGTIYSYRGGVQFNNQGREYNLTMIEVDVGNATNGYHNFYQFISSNPNNNTPILTSGVCDRSFNRTTATIDGINYFPCPALNSSNDIMGIKEQIEGVANIQSLFPDGDETKTTIESYLTNITGSSSGTIGLDNLSTYLRTH